MPGASPRAACREAAGGHAFRDEAERLLRGQLCGQRAQEPEQLAQLHRQRLRAPGARAGQGQPARRQEVQCDQLRRLRPGARREAPQGEEEEAEEEARYLQQCLRYRTGTTLCSPRGCFLPSERAPAWSLQGMGGGGRGGLESQCTSSSKGFTVQWFMPNAHTSPATSARFKYHPAQQVWGLYF